MISQTLARIAASNALLPWLACAGLVIFLSFFVCMLAWVSRREGRVFYGEMGRLPLAEDASGAGSEAS
jgi:cbb3-type cytochrome oxidase subunit 3